MDTTTVILANLPEPVDITTLAKSINTAFGSLVAASETDGLLTIASQGREAIFDRSGVIVGASNSPHSTVVGVTT